MESRLGRRKVSSSGQARSWSRVYQAASAISSGAIWISVEVARALKPSMIEEGKGQGCEEW
jgi:phage major head subunit gpT-like protein